jgi:succinate dehydrogenase / fumarate reductase, cytochrome b subunit
MLETNGRPNRLGVKGWVAGGRWGPERYLYSLHRLTGLGLLTYFLMHVLLTSSRAFGPQAWARAMDAVDAPIFKLGEYLVFAAFAFHAVNGVRLLIVELFGGVGRPIEPIYPYRTSLDVQRPLAVGALALAAVLALLGGLDLLARR